MYDAFTGSLVLFLVFFFSVLVICKKSEDVVVFVVDVVVAGVGIDFDIEY